MSTCNIDTIPTSGLPSNPLPTTPRDLSPHYFAIGAMMNRVSVQNRKLQLERNEKGQPAELLDHQLVFYGCHGFAEVVPKKGTSVHGVVYCHVPPEQMKELDHVERDYIRKTATARLYTGERINVSVYCRTQMQSQSASNSNNTSSCEEDQPPSERYLQVLIEGAQQYGIDKSYIQFLQNHPCRPRPHPSEYLAFTEPNDTMPAFTRQYVEEHGNGLNGNPLLLTCRHKVIEFKATPGNQALVEEFTKTFSQYGDRKVELCMSLLLYDPQFGCPKTLNEVTPEHAKYTEHMMCEILRGFGQREHWDTVARLVDYCVTSA